MRSLGTTSNTSGTRCRDERQLGRTEPPVQRNCQRVRRLERRRTHSEQGWLERYDRALDSLNSIQELGCKRTISSMIMPDLSSLLSPTDYIPHGICLLWQPELIALHVGSDAIAIAYYSIPFALIYFVWKRADLAFPGSFVLSSAFILACGTTHIVSTVTLWQPDYRLERLTGKELSDLKGL